MQEQVEAALQLAEETRLVMVAKQRDCEKYAEERSERLADEAAKKALKAHFNSVQRHVTDGQCGEAVDAAKSLLRGLESWARGKEHWDNLRSRSMQIFFVGFTGEKYILESVRPGDSVDDLKLLIQEKDGVHMKHESVFFAGKQLENGRTLADYNIQMGSTLHLTQHDHQDLHQLSV
jgi:hypothetical protein